MTKEIAIHNLYALKQRIRALSDNEALDMAIKALEQELSEDCISRQAVLDTEYQIKEINDIEYVMLSEVQMKIRKLTSVTPTYDLEEYSTKLWKLAYERGKADVLEKIKTEIVELRSRQNVGVLECLDIIDKYKAESEGKK